MRLTALLLTATFSLSLASSAETINLTPGENIAKIVASAPSGTTFNFAAGYYRNQQIIPKSNDTFIGPNVGHAYLDGGLVITFTPVSGSSPKLWSAKIGSNPLDGGRCLAGVTLCHLTRELFASSALMMPVTGTSKLTSTNWYYDASSGEAIINFDPSSKVMQISTQPCAFCGYASHVTIKTVTVERYASPASSGAIGQNATGTYWTVKNVVGMYNHGGAVQVGANSTVTYSYLHHNGQKGLGANGANITVEKNEIAYNNYAGFDYGWEAGGAKFGSLDTAEIVSNNVHDNNGVGLWDDNNGIYVHYASNTVQNNAQDGIKHEIGYNAVIELNTVVRNGMPPRSSLWNAQINVQNSSYTEVKNNTLIVAADYGSGLVIINQVRSPASGKYGSFVGAHNTVTNNDVTYEGTMGSGGLMGVSDSAVDNDVDNNTYHISPLLNKHHFEAFGVKTFSQFQTAGYDVHGKISWSSAPDSVK